MFKALLASLAATVIASPVSAAFTNQHGVRFFESNDFPLTHQPLFNALEEKGIYTIDGFDWELCQETGANTYYAGFYSPSRNIIVLCTNSPNEDVLNTFTHEAVHAVQDCRAGLDNDDMLHGTQSHMISSLPQDELELIQTNYPRNQWHDEVEARYFADSPAAVTTGVQTFCL